MDRFRYAQFCPIARVAELLGQRWTLLVLRELFTGPQRFSDLRQRLGGVSPSVLTERLAALEAAGMLRQVELPPPTPATVYELTARGRAFEPAMFELTRFGVSLLDMPQAGDRIEPDWVRLAAQVFARADACPPRRFEIRVVEGPRQVRFRIAGGPDGARLLQDPDGAIDLCVTAPPMLVLGLMSGTLPPDAALAGGAVALDGNRDAFADLPALFQVDTVPADARSTAEADSPEEGTHP